MKEWFYNKNVALVGSSESLFMHSFGDKIDSHEVVCRINRGVIIKDPIAQGKRTDIWAIGQAKTVEDLLDSCCVKNIHLSHKGRTYNNTWEGHPKINYYMPMEILDDLRNDLGHKKPSSGLMIAYYIFVSNPKSVTLYGFDWKKTNTWYFEEGAYQPHDWNLEKDYFQKTFLSTDKFKYENL